MTRGLRRVQKPKRPRERPGLDDPAHKRMVKTLRCLLSGKRVMLTRWKGVYPHTEQVTEEYVHVCEYDGGQSDAHHTHRKSQLGHDHTSVPLCRVGHREAERLGNEQFLVVWGIDLIDEARRLTPTRSDT